MKLDVNVLRYLSRDDLRTLQAVELGQKNHELVPIPLIDSIAGLKHGGTVRCLRSLLKSKLVHHDNSIYDSYRLTNLGYDFLAIKTLVNRGVLASIGRQIGVGKESDVFEVMTPEGELLALKLHRLGRTSFRAVKSKRDYLKHRTSFSWLYLSRLAALKEYSFMAALKERGFPVPTAVAHNRHAVVMTLLDACPLNQVRELQDPGRAYAAVLQMVEGLARVGLVHCDLNEFNLMVDEEERLTLIDFPQMVSVSHCNAEDLFRRDLEGITRYFKKKLGYIPEADPAAPQLPSFQEAAGVEGPAGLDVALAASGFKSKHQRALEQYAAGASSGEEGSEGPSDSDDEEEESEAESQVSDSAGSSASGGPALDSMGADGGTASDSSAPTAEEPDPVPAGCLTGGYDERLGECLSGDPPPLQAPGRQAVLSAAGAAAGMSGEDDPPILQEREPFLSHEKGRVGMGTGHGCGSDATGAGGEAEGPGSCKRRVEEESCACLREEAESGQAEDVGEAASEGMRGKGEAVEGEVVEGGRDRRYREVSAVQQRVALEARRAVMRQAAAESARGARKATSKKLRQQTAKSGKC